MYKASELDLNKLLALVLQHNASDLHLMTGEPPILRVDGQLARQDQLEVLTNDAMEGFLKLLLRPEQEALFQRQQDIDLSYSYKESARFRINFFYQKGLLAAAFRLIPTTIKSVEELSLPQSLLHFTEAKQGLVLVVGPTGHGKSTSQAALIDYINRTRQERILTIEDPIEFIYTPDKSVICQREIYVDSPSFSQALKASLREDFNVIQVGEMRDLDSISTVMTIAETGHLVFATLHTNDVSQTVDRIVDVFPPSQQPQIRSQLANVLVGIVSIRLLPQVGGGRVPALEVMRTNNAVRNVIREGKTYELDNIVQTSLEEGMSSMDRSLANLVRQNFVAFEEARAYVKDADYFTSLISKGA